MTDILSFQFNNNQYPTVTSLNQEGYVLSAFLQSWDSSRNIKADFLPELKNVLEKKSEYEEIGSGEGYSAVAAIYPTEVKIHTDPHEKPFIISIQSFEEYVLTWLEFLEKHGK